MTQASVSFAGNLPTIPRSATSTVGSPGPCSECALVRNTGAAAINLAGWKLDAGDRSQRLSLASYPLKKGATVRIHTGRGTTRAGHLLLGSGRPIWNNDGDTGTLIDPHNTTVSRYRY